MLEGNTDYERTGDAVEEPGLQLDLLAVELWTAYGETKRNSLACQLCFLPGPDAETQEGLQQALQGVAARIFQSRH